MRTITSAKLRYSHATATTGAGETALHFLKSTGWLAADEVLDEPVTKRDLLTTYDQLARLVKEPEGIFPTSIDDPVILQVVGEDEPGERSLRRRVLRESLVILGQIDPADRRSAFQSEIAPIMHRGYDSYGLLFWPDSERVVLRIRHSEPHRLKDATLAACAGISSRKGTDQRGWFRRQGYSGVAGSDSVGSLSTTFDTILMKTPAGEVAQVGEVIQLGSRPSVVLNAAFGGPAKWLFYIGALFSALSLALVWRDYGWIEGTPQSWIEGMAGRLATAAFGAQAVAAAQAFNELESLVFGGGTTGRYGASIKWDPNPPHHRPQLQL